MLIQVIEGKPRDVEGLAARGADWDEKLKPGATGYLGSTGGVSQDGNVITIVRFESAEAAAANSTRPEQSAWWAETAKLYDGDVSFGDFELQQTYGDGGSDDAGFVQIIRGTSNPADMARMRELGDQTAEMLKSLRPDIVGGYTAARDDGEFVSVNYFTSEAEARKGEKQEFPPEVQAVMGEMFEKMGDVRFIDLSEPWFSSP